MGTENEPQGKLVASRDPEATLAAREGDDAYELPAIAAEEKAVPLNSQERENEVNEALKRGDFAARIEARMKAGDYNAADQLRHAHAEQDFQKFSEQAGRLHGDIAANEARLKFAKDDDEKDELRQSVRRLKGELQKVQGQAQKAGAVAAQGPLKTMRRPDEDHSDAANFTVLAPVADTVFTKYAPVLGEQHRGLSATLEALQAEGFDGSVPLVLESSQGWRYRTVRNELGDLSVELIDARGKGHKLQQVEGDGQPPVPATGLHVPHSAEAFYKRPLPRADLRTRNEREDAALGLTGNQRGVREQLRRAVAEQGYRIRFADE